MALRLVIRFAPEGATTPSSPGAGSDDITYSFDQERVVIGRGVASDVRLPHRSVSSQHALLKVENGQHTLVDASSTNGTHVNGQRVPSDRPKVLHDGDLLTVGGYILAFHVGRTATPLITAERTAELAKRILRDQRGAGTGALTQPRLVVLNGPHTGESLDVPEPPVRLLVGRGETCQMKLSDANVSREHMEVTRDLDGVLVRNLDSANGVRWGGHAIHERRLKDGDELTIGNTRLLFEDPAEELMKSITAEPDVVLSALPALPKASALPEPVIAASTPTAVTQARRKREGGPTFSDWVIYVFAAAVLAFSVAGILFLLRAE